MKSLFFLFVVALSLFQGCANKTALNIKPQEASLFQLDNNSNMGEVTQKKIYIPFSDRKHREYNPSIVSKFKKALKKTIYIYDYDTDDKQLYIGVPHYNIGYAISFDGITGYGGYIRIYHIDYFRSIESLKYAIKEDDYLSTLNLKIVNPVDLNIDVRIKILDYEYKPYYFDRKGVYIFTLLVETVDYTPLIKKYKQALAEYDVNILKNNDAADLSKFLTNDCNKALKKTSDLKSIEAIEKIASLAHVSLHKKLLQSKLLSYENRQHMKKKYYYYTHNASFEELRRLLHSNKLVGVEYTKVKALKHRYYFLAEKRKKKIALDKEKQKLEQIRKKIEANIFVDTKTGLVWQNDKSVKTLKKDWKHAKQYCQNLTLNGYSDWRLPTVEELHTVVDSTNKVKTEMKNVAYDDGYWSISEDTEDKANAWRIDFNDGEKYTFDKLYKTYIRCVRDKK